MADIVLDSPASLLDMADIHGRMTPLLWDICREMWREGRTWSLTIDGELAGVFGVYPVEGGAEAWFNVRSNIARNMLFVCRQIRLTLDALDYPEIVVFCETEAGRRIAALSGFHFATHLEQREIWRYGKAIRGRRVSEGVSGTSEATAAAAAAPAAG
jgi:hypothetical protein